MAHNMNHVMNGAPNDEEQQYASSTIESAIAAADIYHGSGTTYLHTDNPLTSSSNHAKTGSTSNPTGGVVPSISLATTFKQSEPGMPNARDDPNSFGMGYEYSRTGNPTRGVFERAVAAAENAKFWYVHLSYMN